MNKRARPGLRNLRPVPGKKRCETRKKGKRGGGGVKARPMAEKSWGEKKIRRIWEWRCVFFKKPE